jgi:hypothetical protein
MGSGIKHQIDGAFAGIHLQWLSVPAKIASLLVVLGAVGLTIVIVGVDFTSERPSSTAPLIFPFMALYALAGVGLIALLDWGIRRLVSGRPTSG